MLNWDASSSLIRPQPGSRLRQLTAKFRVLFPQPFEFGLQCAANRPTSSAKTSPATAPVKDEAAQRKLDDAAAAGQQKLADEKLARTEAQWKKVMRSICTGC